MIKYLVRWYWMNESNPDDVLITKTNVEANSVADAYDAAEHKAPAGYQLLNWVVFE